MGKYFSKNVLFVPKADTLIHAAATLFSLAFAATITPATTTGPITASKSGLGCCRIVHQPGTTPTCFSSLHQPISL